MDAKDILGLPKSSLPISLEKKPRAPKESQRRPDGISRELYMLTGGVAPLMPSIDLGHLKKRPPSNEKITWQWLPFSNSARKDDLQLFHWVRVVNGVPPSGDYAFAKYNKSVEITKYTDEEYEKYLAASNWTREETDQLFDLCEQFDLRFVVIADRFPSSRSIEELKERYYNVSRAILVARAASPTDIAGHPLIKDPYNAELEIERKRALSLVLSQTKQQERRDAEVLAEAKRILEARRMAKAADESGLRAAIGTNVENTDRSIAAADAVSPTNLQVTSATTAPSNPTADKAAVRASLRMLRVHLRTFALGKMVEVVNSSAGLLTINRVEQTLQDLGINLKPKVPTKQVCLEHLELRKEIITLLNLQRQLQHKESEGSSYRDGPYNDMPGTPKDHAFVPEPVILGGERIGKKDHKRKGPGRIAEAPSSPALKRARKLKITD